MDTWYLSLRLRVGFSRHERMRDQPSNTINHQAANRPTRFDIYNGNELYFFPSLLIEDYKKNGMKKFFN